MVEKKIFQKKINKSINEMTELYFLATYKSMCFNIKLIHEDLQRFLFRAKTYTQNEFNLNIQKKPNLTQITYIKNHSNPNSLLKTECKPKL